MKHVHDVAVIKSAKPGTERVLDSLVWPGLSERIDIAAAVHGLDYLEARRLILAYYERQTTFHLEAIAESAARPDMAAYEFLERESSRQPFQRPIDVSIWSSL